MNQPVPNKFVLDESAEEPTPRLGDAELEVIDVHEDGNVIVECDHGTLANASLEAFPDTLTVHIHSPDGFRTFLFHEAKIYRDDVGQLVAEQSAISQTSTGRVLGGLLRFSEQLKISSRSFPLSP
jgi:hypothetical protein